MEPLSNAPVVTMLELPATAPYIEPIAVPPIVIASASNVPSISALPDMSKVAASNSPVIVRFLCPVVSMFASVVTTLDAIAVPAVSPSSNSSSASARTALPAVNPVPVTIPVEVIAPEPIVPANVTFAPENVAAVVVPDFNIRLPLLFVAEPNVVPPSLKNTSPPSASKTKSPDTSKVMSVEPAVVELMVKTSVIVPPTDTPNRICPSSLPFETSTASPVIRANS